MLKVNQLAGFGSVVSKTTIHNLYSFDSSQFLYRNSALSGDADGKEGLIAGFLRFNAYDNQTMRIVSTGIVGSTERFYFGRTGNKLQIIGYSSAGVKVLDIKTTTSYTISSGLLHFMASWNLATAAAHFYVNGTDDFNSGAAVLTNTNIDYVASTPTYHIGQKNTGINHLYGCLGGLYLSRVYMDLSNSSNRAKFYNSGFIDNVPSGAVTLGTDGSTPSGSAPLIYLNDGLPDGTNAGSGGNFTVNGVFSAC